MVLGWNRRREGEFKVAGVELESVWRGLWVGGKDRLRDGGVLHGRR